MKHTIYTAPGYQLDAAITDHRITGRTVELLATYPLAQHPRAQRLASFTLPQEAFDRLADVLTLPDGRSPHHGPWNSRETTS